MSGPCHWLLRIPHAGHIGSGVPRLGVPQRTGDFLQVVAEHHREKITCGTRIVHGAVSSGVAQAEPLQQGVEAVRALVQLLLGQVDGVDQGFGGFLGVVSRPGQYAFLAGVLQPRGPP